ncbi:hypothetical protein [Halarcobacter bivalviorum]|uniref:hypothetical protein n=1 Tax=Halarcobacter bivalviorum TaxID=663364 RepID=UPI00100AB884|nr:hypothetical protein [Halarcobacter bivalviorum]RXK06977.1 hypothetical protein CRU97_02395 [Halarcobacter bivalviorum]
MSVNENQKLELFEDFYAWLKNDGLRPKKSERLHKKKIFSNLRANDEMTIENFKDFLNDRHKTQIKAMKGLLLKMNGVTSVIQDIVTEDGYETFTLVTEIAHIKCKKEDVEQIKKQIISSGE